MIALALGHHTDVRRSRTTLMPCGSVDSDRNFEAPSAANRRVLYRSARRVVATGLGPKLCTTWWFTAAAYNARVRAEIRGWSPQASAGEILNRLVGFILSRVANALWSGGELAHLPHTDAKAPIP